MSRPWESSLPDFFAAPTVASATDAAVDVATNAFSYLNNIFTSALDSLSNDPLVRKTQGKAEVLIAQWRWSGRYLSPKVTLPLSTTVDERLVVIGALAVIRLISTSNLEVEGGTRHPLILPPATLALTLACLGIFYKPGGVLMHEVCMSPFCVIEKKEYVRLLLPALIHVDAAHLVHNLAVMIPECAELEDSLGSPQMALELVGLTLLSHGLYVGWSLFEKHALDRRSSYYSIGAVGLSSVAFAVQVVNGVSRRGHASVLFLPISIPRRFVWALQLLINQASNPDSSLIGHVCGVAAGLIHSYILSPALRAILSVLDSRTSDRPQQTRFWGAGTGGGQSIPEGSRNRRSSRWWLGHQARELGIQVVLVAAVTGFCVLMGKQRSGLKSIR